MSTAEERKLGCIYCGSGKEMSREDIVPFALGGRYASSAIICRECNSYFGANVDCHITDWQLSLVARNCFDLEGHSQRVPTYEVETEEGQALVAGPTGELTPKWRDVVQYDDGKVFSFTAGAPTEEAARRAIERVIAKKTRELGRRPNIIESRVVVSTHRDWHPCGADVTYDYAKQGRAIAKMAYHYLAAQLDRQLLCTRDFEAIKRFVRFGEHPRQPRFCQPALAAEQGSTVGPGIWHCLALRCSRQLRSAVCDVALFGNLRFTVVLSYSYEGPDLYRRLIEYPLEGRWEEGSAPDLTPIPARFILNVHGNEHKARYERLEEAVHGLADWLNVQNFCRHIRETLPGAVEAVNSSPEARNLDADDWLAAVADQFSSQSAPAALLHFLGVPSHVAAEVLLDELQRSGAAAGLSILEIEDRFARLIFVRLLLDGLSLIAECRRVGH